MWIAAGMVAAFLAYTLTTWVFDAWLPRRRPEWASRLAFRRRRDLDRERELDPSRGRPTGG